MIPGLHPSPLSCLTPVTLLESSYQVMPSALKFPKPAPGSQIPISRYPVEVWVFPGILDSLLKAHLRKGDPHPMFPISVGQTRNLDVTNESFLSPSSPPNQFCLQVFFSLLLAGQSDLSNTEFSPCQPLIQTFTGTPSFLG